MSEQRKSWLTLAALFSFLLILAVWRPLAVPDEGRYAEVGRWMLHSGDWLIPRLNGIPFFHKPPLLYWLEGVSLGLLGVHPWAARVVPALHAGLMLLTLYLGGRRLTTEVIARRAVWMLGTSLAFLLGGQYVNHDMLVAAWIGVAIWCFALAFLHGAPDAALARWGFVACALGLLSKGLIGVVLPAFVMLIWLAWTRQLPRALRLPWLSGLALFALLALPWFWLAEQRFPGMLDYMFGKHQVGRFGSTAFNNGQPWWFYGACLLVLLFPWTFFALYQALVGARRVRPPAPGSSGAGAAALCWIWLLAIIGFFSIPSSKIIGYALPVMPPLALLAALGWEGAMARLGLGVQAQGRWFAALCAASLALAVAANLAAARYTGRYGAQDVAQALQAAGAQPSDPVYLLGDYAYDLPFYRRASRPMVVLQDWPEKRQSDGDDWQHELLDGEAFDAQAARVLQTPQALQEARGQARAWVVARHDERLEGFIRVFKGSAWTLYRSDAPGSAPESPELAQ